MFFTMKPSIKGILLAGLALTVVSCVPGQPGFGRSVQGTGSVEALERQATVPDAPDVREGQAARAAAHYSNGSRRSYYGW